MAQVLVLGGSGRIGGAVVADLLNHTEADIVATGRRSPLPVSESPRLRYESLDLDDRDGLETAIAPADLVIHCAGPFHHRDGRVLESCIQQRVNYVDVSDYRGFTERVLAHHEAAQAAGVTAVLNTGVFPGLSNSLVRQGIETLGSADTVRISYVVGGSGGAGVTIMRTTFLGLLHPFPARLNGEWRSVKPYSDRQVVSFPEPFGKVGVYWYEMPETWTLAETYPLRSLITKFGSVPDFYNYLTWMTAHLIPKRWLKQPDTIEFLSKAAYEMTEWSDRWSGIGVGIRVDITPDEPGRSPYSATLIHHNTATAAGCGTGSMAAYVLKGAIAQPGVYPVERILTTPLFEQAMRDRHVTIHHDHPT